MKPRSKSVWMVPAAWGAVSPTWMVQARDSLGPAVRKVWSPSVRNPTWTSWTRPDSLLAVPRQQLGGVLRLEGGHLGLDLGAHHHRLGRRHQGRQPLAERVVPERPLVHVEDVDERLGAEEVELGERPGVDLPGGHRRGDGAPAVQDGLGLLGGPEGGDQVRLLP